MFTVDLESAYHHVDMHPDSVPYLGFAWRGQHYVFTSLPFGLTTACWVFTKLMRELVGHWRAQGLRLVHYLDDLLFGVQPDHRAGGTTASMPSSAASSVTSTPPAYPSRRAS